MSNWYFYLFTYSGWELLLSSSSVQVVLATYIQNLIFKHSYIHTLTSQIYTFKSFLHAYLQTYLLTIDVIRLKSQAILPTSSSTQINNLNTWKLLIKWRVDFMGNTRMCISHNATVVGQGGSQKNSLPVLFWAFKEKKGTDCRGYHQSVRSNCFTILNIIFINKHVSNNVTKVTVRWSEHRNQSQFMASTSTGVVKSTSRGT